MSWRARFAVAGLVALVACGPAPVRLRAPDASPSFLVTWREATQSMRAKRFAEAARRYEDALAQSPGDDALMYRAGRAYARAGAQDEAVRALERLAAAGRGLVPEAWDFGDFGETDAFRAAQAKAHAAAARLRKSTVAFRVPERGLMPEGIAYDQKREAFFIGSIKKRKIVKVVEGGRAEDFATGLDAVLGLRVDPARDVLWAATEADESMDGFQEADRGRTALLAFDLGTGKLRARYPLAGAGHMLNDVAITKRGDVFVTDSEGGTIWTLGVGSEALVPALQAGTQPLEYPNGIASDGDVLFVADGYGVYRLEPTSRALKRLTHPPGFAMGDIDGLYVEGNSLIGVQHPGTGRVVAFDLDARREGVTAMRVLDADHPENETPTTGAIAHGKLFFLANSQIGRPNPSGEVIVLAVQL